MRRWGGLAGAFERLAGPGVHLTGVGIEDDILYGPGQVGRARRRGRGVAGVAARYREIRSTKGHDAFLVEWDQLESMVREALTVA